MNHLSKLYNSPLRPFLQENHAIRISYNTDTCGHGFIYKHSHSKNPLWSKYTYGIFYIKLQTLAKFVRSDSTNKSDLTQFQCQRTCKIGDFSIELSTSKARFTVSRFHNISSGVQSSVTVLITHLDFRLYECVIFGINFCIQFLLVCLKRFTQF
jgi:hypothetical protein